MRTYLPLSITVLAISLTCANAQPTRDKAKKLDPPITKDKITPGPKLGPAVANPQIPTTLLSIDQLKASRSLDRKTALVEAVVRNDNLKAVTDAQYVIEHLNGSTWKTLKTGVVSVKARGSASVSVYATVSEQAQQFRIRVPKSAEGSKQLRIAGTVYVVKFRCPDWQQSSGRSPSKSPSAEVVFGTVSTQRGVFLRSIGFEVAFEQIQLEQNKVFVETWYRAPNWVARRFDSNDNAVEFMWQLPAKGVETKLETADD